MAAAGIVVAVGAGVPAAGGDIDAAGKGETVVDDHDLLVMRAAERVACVEPEGDLAVHEPADQHRPAEEPADRLQQAGVPAQDLDLQPRRAIDQPQHELAQAARGLRSVFGMAKVDARVEFPADQHDAMFGGQHGGAHQPEIILGIDDDAGARRTFDAPAFSTGGQRSVAHNGLCSRRRSCSAASQQNVAHAAPAAQPANTSVGQ